MVAIVGSILLAFAIDAGWESRQEAAEAREILIGLRDEFEFHRSELLRHQERWRRTELSMERLLEATQASIAPPAAVMDTLMDAPVMATSFDPRGGALNALIASGRLELIPNRALRVKLAGWQGVVEEVRDNEMAMRDFVLIVITPYLARKGVPLSRSRALWHGRSGLLGPEGGELRGWPSRLMSDGDAERVYRELLADPTFEVLLSTRYVWVNVGEYSDAIAFVDDLLEAIRVELGID